MSCSFRGRHRRGEEDRDRLIEDDGASMRTENLMMSGLSQTSFTSASMLYQLAPLVDEYNYLSLKISRYVCCNVKIQGMICTAIRMAYVLLQFGVGHESNIVQIQLN